MEKESLIWSKILATVLKMPGVKIDRVGFLRQELRPYCNQSRLQMLGSVRPYTIVSDKVIDKLAKGCITKHTALATTASTVAGLPGGLAMAATLPADLTQFFYHVIVLSQKLAYLYGYPDLCDEEGELSDMSVQLLTIFIGVVMETRVAEEGMGEVTKAVAESAVTRLPRVALTKTAIYAVATQVARLVGTRLTKEGFAKGVGRFIPIAGGLFSGGLTLYTFRKGANRLQRQLSSQRHLFKDDKDLSAIKFETVKQSFVNSDKAEHSPELLQEAIIEAMINMAKINDDVTPARFHVVEHQIAIAAISSEKKLELLGSIETEQSFEVDFDLLAADDASALAAIKGMVKVTRASEKMTTAEQIYLNMAAQKLGIDKEQLNELLNATNESSANDAQATNDSAEADSRQPHGDKGDEEMAADSES